MSDIDWLYFIIAYYRGFEHYSEINYGKKKDMNTIRKIFEETIRRKLENPDVTASEVKALAQAYSELTKNDHLHEMMQSLNGNWSEFNSIEASNNG